MKKRKLCDIIYYQGYYTLLKRSILRIKEYFGKKRIERRRHMTEWIITCNINAYNVEGAFDKLDTIDWKQSTYVEKGDII